MTRYRDKKPGGVSEHALAFIGTLVLIIVALCIHGVQP